MTELLILGGAALVYFLVRRNLDGNEHAVGFKIGYDSRGLPPATGSNEFEKGFAEGAFRRGYDDWTAAGLYDKRPDGSSDYIAGWRAAYDESKAGDASKVKK
jgi:hypothetical protein